MSGAVVAFDDGTGLGRVRSAQGAEHRFHCTTIADGTRTIEVGTRVRYVVVPGPAGAWEAAAVTPV